MYIDTTNYKIGIKYSLGMSTSNPISPSNPAYYYQANGKSYPADSFHLDKNNDQLEITYGDSAITLWPNNPKIKLQGDIKEVAMALAILLQQNYDNRHQNIILNNFFCVADDGVVLGRYKFKIEDNINCMLFEQLCSEISGVWKTVKLMK